MVCRRLIRFLASSSFALFASSRLISFSHANDARLALAGVANVHHAPELVDGQVEAFLALDAVQRHVVIAAARGQVV